MVTMDVDEAAPPSCRSVLKEIDELRYSRLIFTLGREAVRAIFESKVLILGCNGVGAEIAKNLVLSGIKGLGLVDDAIVCAADLSAQFLLTEADIGSNRAAASARKLKEMNPHAEIISIPLLDMESSIRSYQVFVATTYNMPYLVDIDVRCRLAGIPFLFALSRGFASVVFADFGDSFSVVDETGEPASAILVESITQDYPATVTVVEEQRHSLEDGDQVIICGVKGMEELNRSDPYTVTVTGSTSFTILEDSRNFCTYLSGGYIHKVKQEKVFEFLPLGRALLSPKICICDPVKASKSLHLHVAFQAISEFKRRRSGGIGSSTAGSEMKIREEEVDEVLKLAEEMWNQLEAQEKGYRSSSIRIVDSVHGHEDGIESCQACADVGICQPVEIEGYGAKKARLGSLDANIVRLLAHGAHSELSPMAAVTGGIAAQEVIKVAYVILWTLEFWSISNDLLCCVLMEIL
jgi:molybdopterin/thiamine biosynthesis adenylyltransferase